MPRPMRQRPRPGITLPAAVEYALRVLDTPAGPTKAELQQVVAVLKKALASGGRADA